MSKARSLKLGERWSKECPRIGGPRGAGEGAPTLRVRKSQRQASRWNTAGQQLNKSQDNWLVSNSCREKWMLPRDIEKCRHCVINIISNWRKNYSLTQRAAAPWEDCHLKTIYQGQIKAFVVETNFFTMNQCSSVKDKVRFSKLIKWSYHWRPKWSFYPGN